MTDAVKRCRRSGRVRSAFIIVDRVLVVFASAIVIPFGCASNQPMNPAFPVTIDEARAHLRQMHEQPKPLERPVIVAAGYLDPGVISADIARRLRRVTTNDAQIVAVNFFWAFSFDRCRDRIIDVVERKFPSDDPSLTTEVDVVGFSMGGLVARYAAAGREKTGKRLNVARLFTIGTPHRGARLAPLMFCDSRAASMRPGSDFLVQLDRDLDVATFEVIPYARLRDAIVGEGNTAPHGREPWWVPNKPLSMSHTMAGADERIIADIARRLRGEEPLTRQPSAASP